MCSTCHVMLLGHWLKDGHKLPPQMGDFLLFHKGSITTKKVKDFVHWQRVFDIYMAQRPN